MAFPRLWGCGVVTCPVPFWGHGKLVIRVQTTRRTKTIHSEGGHDDVPFS